MLGHLERAPGASAGQLRFAVRPAGDSSTIDSSRCCRTGASSTRRCTKGLQGHGTLLGATAADVFSMSKGELDARRLPIPESSSTRVAAGTSRWARSTSACWRRSCSYRAAACSRRWPGCAVPAAGTRRPDEEWKLQLARVALVRRPCCGSACGCWAGGDPRARHGGGHHRDQRHPDRRPPGPGLGHRRRDPHAADAPRPSPRPTGS